MRKRIRENNVEYGNKTVRWIQKTLDRDGDEEREDERADNRKTIIKKITLCTYTSGTSHDNRVDTSAAST